MDQIVRLQSDITRSFQDNEITVAIFLDFEKAFDMVWVDGILLKMRKLNITGKMYNWIKDFLSNRTAQVQIGDAISKLFHPENGTPQGSIISPLLFIILMNDFPILSHKTKTSLFADDSSLWRSGPNLRQIIHHLQLDLHEVEKWCLKWGFKLNESKTIGIVFAKRNIQDKPKLFVKNCQIPFKTCVTFLGVNFDAKLTWKNHVDSIIDRCKPKLNILRCISGLKWGASKSVMLMIYKALIRSIIDYGSIVYYSAATYILKKLDTLQCKSLRLCTGAMKSTPLTSLQVECCEPPLQFRRERLLLKFCIKIDSMQSHSTKYALILSNNPDHNLPNKPTMAMIYSNFMSSFPEKVFKQILTFLPPWLTLGPSCNVDISLLSVLRAIKMEESPVNEYVENYLKVTYPNFISVYTDGSVNKEYKTGIGIFIPSINLQVTCKLSNSLLIKSVELAAINRAVDIIESKHLLNALILTDSMAAIKDIETNQYHFLSRSIIEKLEKLKKQNFSIILCWIPSHSAIHGNEMADFLAKDAINQSATVELQMSLEEKFAQIDKFIEEKWLSFWRSSPTGLSYKSIFKELFKKPIKQLLPRFKETCITRLRLQHCHLNSCLKTFGFHATGLCCYCGIPETVEHFLTECKNNEELINCMRALALNSKNKFNLKWILSNEDLYDLIYDYICKNEIKI